MQYTVYYPRVDCCTYQVYAMYTVCSIQFTPGLIAVPINCMLGIQYTVYSLPYSIQYTTLGLIAVPINCMLGMIGSCSYDLSHPDNYALPYKICRIEGNQVHQYTQSERRKNTFFVDN